MTTSWDTTIRRPTANGNGARHHQLTAEEPHPSRIASSPDVNAGKVLTSPRRLVPFPRPGTRIHTFTSALLMSIPAQRS
ncbi:hypothetical protein OHA02_51695 [Streptomyces phaeochromogenes]|nr:hypothetical protein [Streptomyces phaeochromogenes]